MANPGTFEQGWLSDERPFGVIAPKSGGTGDFEQGWLSDVQPFGVLASAPASGGVVRRPNPIDGIGERLRGL